jgi:nucleoside diphosphate kinase
MTTTGNDTHQRNRNDHHQQQQHHEHHQRSLALIKSDAVFRIDDIIRRITAADLKIINVNSSFIFTLPLAHRFYHHVYGRQNFYQKLQQIYPTHHTTQHTSYTHEKQQQQSHIPSPVAVIEVARHNAVQRLQNTIRNSDYTIRRDVEAAVTPEIAWHQLDCVFPRTLRSIVVLGAPSSGKGTQCELIAKAYNLVHIATGDLLRDDIRGKQSTLSSSLDPSIIRTIKETVASGQLVDDEIVYKLLHSRLQQADVQKLML